MIKHHVICCLLLFMLAGGAFAKDDAPAGNAPESPALPYLTLMLARDPAVQRELKLNEKQKRQLAAAVAEIDQPMWLLRDVPVAECREQLEQHRGTLLKQLSATLTAAQQQRFDQVLLQARGFKALASDELARSLKLTEPQRQQIGEILARSTTLAADKNKSPHTSASGNARNASQEILGLLTAEQSSNLGLLTGKSFDVSKLRQIGCQAPELRNVSAWVGSEPFTLESQRGKVVVLHYWAFGCINCVRNLPHYQSWFEKFPNSALTIVGVHTPETEREKSTENVRQAIAERDIKYPVAIDGAAENWKAWGNRIWPAVYLIDKQGQVRNWWYGELNWQGATGEEFMRQRIAELIAEK